MQNKSRKLLFICLSGLLISLPNSVFASELEESAGNTADTGGEQVEVSATEASAVVPVGKADAVAAEAKDDAVSNSADDSATDAGAEAIDAEGTVAEDAAEAADTDETVAEDAAALEVEADVEVSLATTEAAEEESAEGGLSTSDLSTGITSAQLAQSLLGEDVEIKNVKFTGAEKAAGTFTGGSGIIGFNSGIILSSGDIANVVGPNKEDDVTGSNGKAGDADLNKLIPDYQTNDAAVLEFDFIPVHETAMFKYVFSSDEYNEFVNSSYNDVFGFFINGSNMALIPGTSTPVSINNVNGGDPIGTNASNSQYYRNNDLDDGGSTINTEMDGLTVVLTVQALVKKGELNHIKMAIADAGDNRYDSNVFIQAGSFTSVDKTPPAELTVNDIDCEGTQISGTTEANATVTAKVAGQAIGTTKSNESGAFSINIAKQKAETAISVYAADEAGNVTEPTNIVVSGTASCVAPTEPVKPEPDKTKPEPVKPTPVKVETPAKTSPTSGQLPDTATNNFNLLFAGLGLMLMGGAFLVIRRLRKQ